MKIRVLQHAAFEGPGEIGAWAEMRGHSVQVHPLYEGASLPGISEFDLLVVMGGGMNIYQDRDHPWLKPEREFIRLALKSGKRVVGICLGSQFIADALGQRVVQNPQYELGWLPVTFTAEGRKAFPALPPEAVVLHWHGDTFGLPDGAIRLGFSAGCPEQGFVIKGKCLGLQFHFETNPELVAEMVRGSTSENWWKGPYVQAPDLLLADACTYYETNRKILFTLLDQFCAG